MKQLTIWIQIGRNEYRGIDLLNIVKFSSHLSSNKIDRSLVLITKDHKEIHINERYKGRSMFLFETIVEFLENPNRENASDKLFNSIKTYNDAISHQYHLESAKEFLQRRDEDIRLNLSREES